MDANQAIVELVKITIWPVVVILAMALFWKPIQQKIPFLNSLKIGKLQAEFKEQVAQVEKEFDEKIICKPESKLFSISPTAAVLQSWQQVVDCSKHTLKLHDLEINFDDPEPYKSIETVFTKSGLMKTKDIKVFRELRQLRNKIAHAKNFEIEAESARQFVAIADKLQERILAISINKAS